jgi:hypothetical protein
LTLDIVMAGRARSLLHAVSGASSDVKVHGTAVRRTNRDIAEGALTWHN